MKNAIKFLFKKLKGFSILLLFSLILISISTYLTLKMPVLIGNAIDFIIDKDNVNFTEVYKLLKTIGIFTLIIIFVNYLYTFINNYIAMKFSERIRNEAFEKIMKLPISYIDTNSHGMIVNNVITNVNEINDGLILGFQQFFTGILTIILTIVFMFKINWFISIIIIVLSPLSIFAAKFISKRTYTYFKAQSEARGKQTGYIDDTITNAKLIMAFNQEENSIDSFDEINDNLAKISIKSIFISSLTNPVTRFINNLIYAIVAIVGLLFIVNGYFGIAMTVGMLSTILNYANQYTKPFNDISSVITELSNAIACTQKICELLESEEIDTTSETITDIDYTDKISFNNLSFGYTKDKLILNGLDFDAYKGHTVAIVGPTGCGKTTLINLLMRFYNPNSGNICIDDNNLANINRSELREKIGMVLQETWLKAGSIRDNLTLGKENASDEEIYKALNDTYSLNFVERLNGGLDYKLKENGEELSEGERQLLSIARVMIANPEIIILDEATSSIDSRTEILIQKAFDKLMRGKTSFVVAHRLKTIINADVIIVIKDGKIIETGNHNELLAKNGFYHELYNSQFAK